MASKIRDVISESSESYLKLLPNFHMDIKLHPLPSKKNIFHILACPMNQIKIAHFENSIKVSKAVNNKLHTSELMNETLHY